MTRIPVNPELLTWARERADYSHVRLSQRLRDALVPAHPRPFVTVGSYNRPTHKLSIGRAVTLRSAER